MPKLDYFFTYCIPNWFYFEQVEPRVSLFYFFIVALRPQLGMQIILPDTLLFPILNQLLSYFFKEKMR